MEPAIDSSEERQPYEPLPFRLTRAGTYPDVEDAVEDVLTAAHHMKHEDTLVNILVSSYRFMTDPETRNDAQEYIRTCQQIRGEVISVAKTWSYDRVGPDELIASAHSSNRRQWYLEPLPIEPDKYIPLIPDATLGDNRLFVAMGFLLGSSEPYQDWVKLWTEIEFGKGCWAEIASRMKKRTTGAAYLSLTQGSVPVQEEAYRQLLERARAAGNGIFLHPDKQQDLEEKISEAGLVISKDLKRFEMSSQESIYRLARDMVRGDFEGIGDKFYKAFVSKIRKITAKKRIPQKDIESLESLLERHLDLTDQGDRRLRQSEVRAKVAAHENELKATCGPSAAEVVRCILEQPGIKGAEIAEQVGLGERQVKNIRKCLRQHRDLIERICRGE